MANREHPNKYCTHKAHRAIVMGGKVMHWRCGCDKIVAAPVAKRNPMTVDLNQQQPMASIVHAVNSQIERIASSKRKGRLQ